MVLDATKMKDWEIAEEAEKSMKTVYQLAEELGLEKEELLPHGHYFGKVDFKRAFERLKDKPNAKYIDVTAITPTPLGEGKSTSSMGLVEGMGKRGKRVVGTVEQGVRLAQTYILGRLRHQTFFSLADCNAAIRTALEDLNGRAMRRLGVSRKDLFETIERPALRPLPAEDYEFAVWQFARVGPDYHVEIRRDVLEEEDGPMLRHGLQGLHGQRILVPRRADWRPSPDLLERRYHEFLAH